MKKYKTSFLISVFALAFLFVFFYFQKIDILGESVNLNVTVGNNAPTFSAQPFETPASDGTTPTTIGANVTFRATGSDANLDKYYLLVCKTGDAPTPGSSAAPECNGGVSNRYCVSAEATNGVAVNCIHSTTSETAETYDWYAFVCDKSLQSSCSAYSQGAGSSGSPYNVNHAPTFPVGPSQPGIAPGGTAVFTVLESNWTETDSNPTQDTAKLLVCATAGITSGACTGTQLCASSPTAPVADLTCSYDDSANPVKSAGIYDAYVYIVDNHNLEATGAAQGTNVGYAITNATPVISNIIVNGGSNITLSQNTSITSTVTATITDANGCQNLAVNPVSLKFYRSGIGGAGFCNTDDSSCKVVASTSCTVSGNTCTGPTDADVGYSCDVSLGYYIDPTDGNVSTNPYYDQTWNATVSATDQASSTGELESTPGVEVLSMNAIQITSLIDYGNLGVNEVSGGGLVNTPVTVTNVGNVGLDLETKANGSGLMCSTSATCGTDNIAPEQQKWEYANNTTTYAASTHSLTTSLVSVPLHILKPTESTHPTTKDMYWALMIPLNQAYGTYSGSNTINSVVSGPLNW